VFIVIPMKTKSLTRITIPLSYYLATTNPVPVRIQPSGRTAVLPHGRRPESDPAGLYRFLCETCARLGLNRCERHYHRVGLIRQPQIPCWR